MKNALSLATILVFTSLVAVSQSQTTFVPKVVPPSPNASSLGKYGDVPVGYYNGLPNINIPIYTISEKGITIPISVSYHASGIKISEESSNVGLGWALNAGGVISRTIIGEDDFDAGRYFSSTYNLPTDPKFWQPTYTQFGTFSGTQSIYNATFYNSSNVVTVPLQIEEGKANEYEPDQYSFNVGGYSGKFMITKDKKIVLLRKEMIQLKMIGDNPSTGLSWELKTPDGTTYLFSELESYTVPGSILQHATAWYVKTIKTPDQGLINFNYLVTKGVETYIQGDVSETLSGGAIGQTCSAGFSGSTLSRSPLRANTVIHISEIDFSNGRVQFLYDSREDIVYDKKLSTIKIIKKDDNAIVKSFDFSYAYFDGTGDVDYPATGFGSVSKRLKLVAITEKSGLGQNIPAHKFEYFEGSNYLNLPAKTSFAKDHWGYFNGKLGNTSMIPTYTVFESTDPVRYAFGTLTGTERDADPLYTKAFTLKKITYPTGGTSEFDYETHDYDVVKSQERDNSMEASNRKGRVIQQIKTCNFTNPKGTSQDFIIDLTNAYFNYQVANTPVKLNAFCLFSNPISCQAAWQSNKVKFQIINQSTGSVVGVYDMLTMTSCDANNTGACVNRGCGSDGKMMGIEFKPYTLPLTKAKYICRIFVENGSDFSVSFFTVNLSWYETIQTTPGSIAYAGGLRIKKITTYDGKQQSIKKFNYRFTENGVEYSAGRLMTKPQYSYFNLPSTCKWEFTNGYIINEAMYLYRSSNSMIALNTSAGGSIVGYDKVEVLEGENGENGKSIYYYENLSDIVNDYGYNRTPIFASIPNQSNGNLLKQEDYKKENNAFVKVRESENVYTTAEALATVWGCELRAKEGVGLITKNFFVFYPALRSYYYYTKSSTEKIYASTNNNQFTQNKTEYFYENPNHLQLTKKNVLQSTTLSDGTPQQKQYTYQYPLDLALTNSVYQDMVNQNIHTPVVIQKLYIEKGNANQKSLNLLSTQTTNFKKWYSERNILVEGKSVSFLPFFAPETITTQQAGGPVVESIKFSIYDVFGNPAEYQEKDGIITRLYYYGVLDVGKVNLIKQKTVGIGTGLEQSTTYDHYPLVGIKSITSPNGLSTYYNYDAFGRLKEIKNNQQQIIKKYEYGYRQ